MNIEQKKSEVNSNPFSSEYSGFGVAKDGHLISNYPQGSEAYEFHHSSHEYFKNLILNPNFACVAGQSSVKGEHYAFCAYPSMDSYEVAERRLS